MDANKLKANYALAETLLEVYTNAELGTIVVNSANGNIVAIKDSSGKLKLAGQSLDPRKILATLLGTRDTDTRALSKITSGEMAKSNAYALTTTSASTENSSQAKATTLDV